MDDDMKAQISEFIQCGGKLILSGNGASLGIPEVPVHWLKHSPTTPSYLRLDDFLVRLKSSELSAEYDYVFYDTAHIVRAHDDPGVETFGDLESALFNRTWRHLTSHAHAPVGESLGAPLVVRNKSVLYFSAPLFTGYKNHDYHVYGKVVFAAMEDWLPPRLIIPRAAGFLEFSLHTQVHPRRKNVHIVTYHSRRSFQGTAHCDQSMGTAGVGFKLLDVESWGAPKRVYLAPNTNHLLEFSMDGNYIDVNLPTIYVHTVVSVEW
jgi:hypothetical protein